MSSAADTGTSTSAFVSSLIFNLIVFTIFIFLFIQLRPSNKRVYQPRTLNDIKTMKPYERLPSGEDFESSRTSLTSYFSWVPVLLKKPHSFLIQHCSLDGYFFLRYISSMFFLSLAGCFILLPILLPVDATNGADLTGFSLLSMSNVTNHNRYYAHIFLSWIYFGFILWLIYREMYYYTTIRHAVQVTPLMQSLVASKTVILTDYDMSILDKDIVYREFDNIEEVTIGQDFTKLEKNCQERDKLSAKLENTLNKQINKSMKKVRKWEKKGKTIDESLNGKPKEDFQSYTNKRPHHKLKKKWFNKIPFIGGGEKVDSIDYYLKRIDELNKEIAHQQENWKTEFDPIGAMFIQFKTQYDAQKCYQAIDYILEKGSFGQKYIGYGPNDLLWENVSINKKIRIGKEKVATTTLVLLLIFWSIPVAVVGCISNINFLTNKVPFLKFIDNCPEVILGLITGLLPTILLAVLMMLVPIFIKIVGKKSGLLTYQEIELYCQKWYFAFQVIEVFIVTTLASSATSSVTAIINDPSSALTLLAENLPKASNFYIAYFMLLGLTAPSGQLLQVVGLILSKVLGRVLDSTPRQKWNRYNTLSKPSWGIISPIIELLAVLFICYAIIQPLLLLFSTLALGLFYLAYLYTYNYVSGFSENGLKGRVYLRALFHLFTALYLAEVCLIGLFVMGKNWGAVVLESVTLVATAGCHIFYKKRFLPLVNIVPLSIFDAYDKDVIHLAEYPEDQGYKDLVKSKEQILEMEKAKEEKETTQFQNGEFIRPATDDDLARANFLPRETGTNENFDQNSGKDNMQNVVDSTFVNEQEDSNHTHEEFNKLHYSDVKNKRKKVSFISLNPEFDSQKKHNQELDLESYPSNANKFNKAGLIRMARDFFFPSKTFTLAEVYKRLPHFYELIALDGGVPRPDLHLENSFGLAGMASNKHPNTRNALNDEPRNDGSSEDYKSENSSAESENNQSSDPFKNGLGPGNSGSYLYPRLNDPEPIIWICKDDMNISVGQITYANNFGVDIRDSNTAYDEKGSSKYLGPPPDFKG